MPSALETLMKILRLEREQGYKNGALIGGLGAFAGKWQVDAHTQARRPEHHALVDELVVLMQAYEQVTDRQERHQRVRYMMDRITGRAQPGETPAQAGPQSGAPPVRRIEKRAPEKRPGAGVTVPRDRRGPRPAQPAEAEAASPPVDTPIQAAPSQPPAVSQPPAAPPSRPVRESDRPRRERPASGPKAQPAPHKPRQTPPAPRSTEAEIEDESDLEPEIFSSEQVGMGLEDIVPAEGDASEAMQEEPVRPKPRRKSRRGEAPADALERLHGLNAPVTVVERVGERVSQKLARLNLHTVEDLLYHLPRRYDDYTRMVPIHRAEPGGVYTLIGSVRTSMIHKARPGREFLQVTLDDGTATLEVFFFGQPYLARQLKRGVQVVVSGKTESYLGKLSMSNPEWELLEFENLHTRSIVPVYPLTKGLTGRTMRRILKTTVDYWAGRLPDFVPESVLDRADLGDRGWALRQVHFPEHWDYLRYARERLAFDELLILQLAMLARRRAWQQVPGVPLAVDDDWLAGLNARLPFTLTGAQQQALNDIRTDMARAVPMNRLLQGDVGSGKTIVAALAMAIAVQNGGQAALMAPTSILAEQHFQSITATLAALLPDREIAIRLLTGATPPAERDETLARLADGTVSIVVGTHALIQSGVSFHNLTLAIVDEQHRFGVEQRGQLRSKGTNPHLLVMTATPIPRTLALTLHADLDLSVINELPPGRTPVETHVMSGLERERAYSFIDQQIAQGRQAFIVYPLVEAEDEEDEARAAVDEYGRLSREVFRNRRLGLLHGRMKADEKEAVMAAFKAGELDILVSTSVVEVGIDIPNASVILVEDASRFGLAQLHQFRGRVGRGAAQSYCLLMGETGSPEATQRLEAMTRTTDGFELAEIDFRMRGAGDLLGLRQSGLGTPLRFGGDINPPLVALAQREARTLYEEDPDLRMPEHQLLAERVAMWRAVQADLS